jgi:YesN/AraC family two-component response regulator
MNGVTDKCIKFREYISLLNIPSVLPHYIHKPINTKSLEDQLIECEIEDIRSKRAEKARIEYEKVWKEKHEREMLLEKKRKKAAMLLELGNQPLNIKGKHYMQKLSDVSKDEAYCQHLMDWSTKFLESRDFAVRKSHNLLEKYLRRIGMLVIEEVEVDV